MKLALKLSQAWPEIKDIYSVGFQGTSIGKVWRTHSRGEGDLWDWQVSIPMQLPDNTKGQAGSLNEALNAFAAAFGTLVTTTPPERFDRAMKLLQAVDLPRPAPSQVPAGDAAQSGLAASRILRGSKPTAGDPAPAQADVAAVAADGETMPEPIAKEAPTSPIPLVVPKRIRRPPPSPALPVATMEKPIVAPAEESDLAKNAARAAAAVTPVEAGPAPPERGGTSILRDLQSLLARHA